MTQVSGTEVGEFLGGEVRLAVDEVPAALFQRHLGRHGRGTRSDR